jgi:hypothetical protein
MSLNRLDLSLDVKGLIELNGESLLLHGSPTTTVRQHVIRALYDGTLLSKITKIALVDTGGTERDSTTSLSYSVSGNQLTITCSITATASYTIGKVRAYAGTILYFETTPSTQPTVASGDVVNITLTITVSISGTLTYAGTSYSMTMVNFGNLVCNVFAGNKTASDLKIAGIVFVGQVASINVTPTNTLSADGLSVTTMGSTSITTADTLTAVEVWAPALLLWKYTGLSVSLPAGSTVSYSETVSA